MIATELLNELRIKLGNATDYKIAQVLDISKKKISAMRAGRENPDAYDCAKIAEILGRDPLEVIAQVEAEAARTEKKREFWRSFFSGLRQATHVVALFGILGISAAGWPVGTQANESSQNVRLRLRSRRNKPPEKAVFFCFAPAGGGSDS